MENRKRYLEYLGTLKNELVHTTVNTDSVDALSSNITNTELIIPVIGAFSAGKSTLLNSFLKGDYLSVDITPETALATELRYSTEEYIEAVRADDIVDKYGIADKETIKDRASEYKFIKVFLNNEGLKRIAPLVLVDMPGFDSPLDLHNKAIMAYVNRGVHFIVLTSVVDGNITKSMLRQLSDIQEFERDFSFFLSKVDLKPESEVAEITKKVDEQINDNFNIRKNIVSTGLGGGNNLAQVMGEIDPEELCKKIFLSSIKSNFYSILDNLNVAISSLKKDRGENERAIQELKEGIDKISEKRAMLIEEAHDKYSDVHVDAVVNFVGKELSGSIDELLPLAHSGDSDALSTRITEIVRHSLISKIKSITTDISDSIINDFSSEIKGIDSIMASFSMGENWTEKLSSSIKGMFSTAGEAMRSLVQSREETPSGTSTGKDALYKVATTILAVTTNFVLPVLELVIIFLPNILSTFYKKKQEEQQKAQIRSNILTSVIPSIKRTLREKVPAIFDTQVKTLIDNISSEFEVLLQEKKVSIAEIEEEKKNTITNIEEELAKYELVRNTITELANTTIFKGDTVS